ncbi:large subunit ribosomal protein L25 [Kineothrix alysoides]|uniref:Large subunit ribosomal protein L25 n=1 Tax=Kineothrix alysoides TaxID=1469948 RepID=A0A4R1R395_9FIRM|nr:5S rRNA E-loop-binding protein [Kineothrix alysoides]TCL59891.1 large subunit ribosomal protein L25 [Kineothrix alysoides]
MNTILAQKRDQAAKAKQLRRSGIVPCVICGASLKESLSVQIDQSTARQLQRTKRNGSKVNIQVDGKTYPTLIKDLEYNGMNNEILHISFQVLDARKKFNSVADIVLLNKEKVAGILEQMQMQIPHAAEPEYLLDTVTVNLENMPIGTTLTIGDIPEFQSDKIELQADAGSIVLRISDKKRVEEKTEQ